MAPFHAPLNPKARQIRLVRITPRRYGSEAADVIACEMAIFDLDRDPPPYTALSYCWTTAQPIHHITINGELFLIRPRLYFYLERLRDEVDDQWTFIDAVCIDQTDVDEKARQVALMGDVYRNAVEVDAWLGTIDEIPQSQRTLWVKACAEHDLQRGWVRSCSTEDEMTNFWKKICHFGDVIVTQPDTDEIQSELIGAAQRISVLHGSDVPRGAPNTSEVAREASEICNRYVSRFNGLEAERITRLLLEMGFGLGLVIRYALCCHDYWTRVWIVQETMLAQRLTIRLGEIKMDWRVLLLFLLMWQPSFQTYTNDDWNDENSDEEPVLPVLQFLMSESHQRLNFGHQMAHSTYTRGKRDADNIYAHSYFWFALVTLQRKRLLQERARRHQVPLTAAFIAFGQQKCSVPHDSVYGMLGMTQRSVKVDYSSSVADLYIRTFVYMYEQLVQEMETVDTAELFAMGQLQVVNSITPFLYRELGLLTSSFIINEVTQSGQLSACNLVLTQNSLTSLRGNKFGQYPPQFFRGMLRTIQPMFNIETFGKCYNAGERLDYMLFVCYRKIDEFVRGTLLRPIIARSAVAWLSLCRKLDVSPSPGLKARRALPDIRSCSQWVQYLDNMWAETEE